MFTSSSLSTGSGASGRVMPADDEQHHHRQWHRDMPVQRRHSSRCERSCHVRLRPSSLPPYHKERNQYTWSHPTPFLGGTITAPFFRAIRPLFQVRCAYADGSVTFWQWMTGQSSVAAAQQRLPHRPFPQCAASVYHGARPLMVADVGVPARTANGMRSVTYIVHRLMRRSRSMTSAPSWWELSALWPHRTVKGMDLDYWPKSLRLHALLSIPPDGWVAVTTSQTDRGR